MPKTLIICAHPRPRHSVVTSDLRQTLQAAAAQTASPVEVRDLYALYPDFDIDVIAEQQALTEADLVIWLCPVYWYSVPALLKHWFDKVLTYGWAYGEQAHALRGKSLWWVTSAGAESAAYREQAAHGLGFEAFVAPIEHVARYCGMRWLPYFVVHAGQQAPESQRSDTREALARQFQAHLAQIELQAPASGEPAEQVAAITRTAREAS
jgi:glutathione-regulated potassium-efflux system ancillary protein KefF